MTDDYKEGWDQDEQADMNRMRQKEMEGIEEMEKKRDINQYGNE